VRKQLYNVLSRNKEEIIMATMKKSNMTRTICTIAGILVIAASLLLSTTQVAAETLKSRIVAVDSRLEYIDVGEVEGNPLGITLHEAKGLSMFENGEVAFYKFSGQFQTMVGARGFAVNTFEDGSTQWTKYQATVRPGEGGEVEFFTLEGTFEYIGGTGRFEGIRGKGSYTAKYFPTYGVMYVDATAEYALP